MSLHLAGVPGKDYAVESSTNLVDWLRAQVIPMGQEGMAEAQYSVDRMEPQRYFRIGRATLP